MTSNAPPPWLTHDLGQQNIDASHPFDDSFTHDDMPVPSASGQTDWGWLELPDSPQPPPQTSPFQHLSWPPHDDSRSESLQYAAAASSETSSLPPTEQAHGPQVAYADPFAPLFETSVPGEMSCISWYPKGDASITYTGENGTVETVSNLNPWIIEERCPLIAQAFESSNSGRQLHLEALTSSTVHPFLRYLYTGTYSLNSTDGRFEDVPSSVLLHCQLHQLGDIYDIQDLKSQAYVNVLRQCEFGCSSPEKPIDLCRAIKFVYEKMESNASLIETIVNYCVCCFLSHGLGSDLEFKQLAYDLRPFHQALCQESMSRQFENDTASAIIQMPFKPYAPAEYASRENADVSRFNSDIVFHFHANDEFDHAVKKRKTSPVSSSTTVGPPRLGNISLALRSLRQPQEDTGAESSMSKKRAASPVLTDLLGPIDTDTKVGDSFVQWPALLGPKSEDEALVCKAEVPEVPSDEGSASSSSSSFAQVQPPDPPVSMSDAEYDFVAAAGPVDDVEFWSDSDTSTTVLIRERPPHDLPALPFRPRAHARSERADSAGSGSDSEWLVL